MTQVLTITKLRKCIQPYVASKDSLTCAQVLLKAAAFRLITFDQFEAFRVAYKGHGRHEVKQVQWPEQQEDAVKITRRSRPDVKIRKEQAKFIDQDTITWTWRNLCKVPDLTYTLEGVLHDVNRVIFEAYELANLHILRLLRAQKPICVIDQTFFYRCCTLVCYDGKERARIANNPDPELDKTAKWFDDWRKPLSCTPVQNSDMRPFWQSISQDMLTATVNLVHSNFFRRLYKYVKKTVDCKAPYASRLFAYICGDKRDVDTSDPFVIKMRNLLPSVQLLRGNIHMFMPLMWRFQKNADGNRHSLLPHKGGFTTSFVTVHTGALRALLVKAGAKNLPPEPKFLEQADMWWRKFFKIDKLETRNRKFGNQLSTDGKTVSVNMRKPKRDHHVLTTDITISEYGGIHFRIDVFVPSVPLITEHMIVRSVDPGHRQVYTSTGVELRASHEAQALTTSRCSAGEFYHKTGYKKSTRKIQKWTIYGGMAKMVADLPKKHYDNVASGRERVVAVWKNIDKLEGFYGTWRFRNQRLRRQIGARTQLRAMCLELTKDGRERGTDVVIGYGDWSKGDGIKGQPCGPYVKLKNELRKYATIVDVDEYRTSKTCSQCHNHTLKNMRSLRLDKKTWKESVVKVHGVLHCSNSDCKGKTWDRDVNASRNILLLTMLQLRKWRRPECMNRGQIVKGRRRK